jgi:hypothetical protein
MALALSLGPACWGGTNGINVGGPTIWADQFKPKQVVLEFHVVIADGRKGQEPEVEIRVSPKNEKAGRLPQISTALPCATHGYSVPTIDIGSINLSPNQPNDSTVDEWFSRRDQPAAPAPPNRTRQEFMPGRDFILESVGQNIRDNSAGFIWRLRPSIGNFVAPGEYVLLANVLLTGADTGTSLAASISTRWRTRGREGALGPKVDEEFSDMHIPFWEGSTEFQINWSELKDNRAVVILGDPLDEADTTSGRLWPSGRVRVGETIMDTNHGLRVGDTFISFEAPADQLARNGAYFVRCDGAALEIVAYHDHDAKIRIDTAIVVPMDQRQSLVTVHFNSSENLVTPLKLHGSLDPSKHAPEFPFIVAVGDRVFGLSSTPFESRDSKTIVFLAPTELLMKTGKVTIKRLFWGQDSADTAPLVFQEH